MVVPSAIFEIDGNEILQENSAGSSFQYFEMMKDVGFTVVTGIVVEGVSLSWLPNILLLTTKTARHGY